MTIRIAAILPSRNEPGTIGAVAAAIDTAFGRLPARPDIVLVNADSSDTPDTSRRFADTLTHARKVALTGLPRGKGAQILAAARHPEVGSADAVLIADTDTRAPDAAVYFALLRPVLGGSVMTIADYPRHWDEANLTNHLARPILSATTGYDVPQPLAGDFALSGEALHTAVTEHARLPEVIAGRVDGYGIDTFVLHTATTLGSPRSVEFGHVKRHAASFPHLPEIYHQAVPVLLHLAAARARAPRVSSGDVVYRSAERSLPNGRLTAMISALDALPRSGGGYDDLPWPLPIATAWRAVRSGIPAVDAARDLWPRYLDRVRAWLIWAEHATATDRAERLATAHANLSASLVQGAAP